MGKIRNGWVDPIIGGSAKYTLDRNEDWTMDGKHVGRYFMFDRTMVF